jgi:ParD-like antitoxin of type II bacterial toxin-antitoxin system
MPVTVKLSDELVKDAEPYAAAEHRSVSKQIEYWARIGKAVLDNPELPLRFIQDTMLSLEAAKAEQVTPYK